MMRFRPRYSLLTLLVITALVAGGVKLWHGPHRVVMSNPPTAEERLLLEKFWLSESQKNECFPPVVYEYEYLNVGNERQYQILIGRSVAAQPIFIYKWKNQPKGYLLDHKIEAKNYFLNPEIDLFPDEVVVCWVINPQGKDTFRNCYLLTNHQQIYRYEGFPDDVSPIIRIKFNEIEDSQFREIVVNELNTIPQAR